MKDKFNIRQCVARAMTLALLWVAMGDGANAQRLSMSMCDDWKFLREPSSVTADTRDWQSVTLPHTWNAEDGQLSGKNRLDDNGHSIVSGEMARVTDPAVKFGYYRGPAWYQRILDIPSEWNGRRVFVRFEAASQVARIYINGQMLGEHRGAFTAFCYELTPYLQYGKKNELRVEVDNTHRQDIPPLSGDFNVNGGLYRPVSLIVTPMVCISPLDYASPGVYITPRQLSEEQAVVEVRTMLSNGHHTAMTNELAVPAEQVEVVATVLDAEGRAVACSSLPVSVEADTQLFVSQQLTIGHPVLWQGRQHPYLYHVGVAVRSNGCTIDSMAQPLGLREFSITDEDGFLLNGQPYPIYGVGRHQDLKGKAWAMTIQDNERDFQIMKELGATAIRFAHYPQSQNMHDIADREGFLVWDEIPLVNEIRLDYASKDNVRTMMQEMIHQLYNHPSLAWWGIYNELENIYTPPSEQFLCELRDSIRAFDGTCRIIVGASDHGKRPHNAVPEMTCFNNYPGWYHGNFPKEEGYEGEHSQFAKWISDRSMEVGHRIAISEYGAGGDATQHTEGTPRKQVPAHGGPFQPEEWIDYVHEEDWRIMHDNPNLWGTFLWSMFDFASCMRSEGSVPSVNTKGIVSQDRELRKDPYYFYKSNWNPEPMVYITSRRAVSRTSQVTDVKIYSNCRKVTLRVNGHVIATQQPDEVSVCLFSDVRLNPGTNVIEVTGTPALGKKVRDCCEWTLMPGL